MCAGTNRTKRKDRSKQSNDHSDQSEAEKPSSERTGENDMATADERRKQESINAVGPELSDRMNGFEDLDVSQVAYHEYRVLSTRNGTITAHEVNVVDLSCSCQDAQFNKQGSEVCAHLAKCLLSHSSSIEEDAIATRDMRIQVDRVAQIKRDLEDIRDVESSIRSANAQAAADTSGEDEPENGTTDPVELAENFMERNGIDPTGFDISVHDRYGSINIALDGCTDETRVQWKELAQETDGIMWDGDEMQNFVKEDRIGEVFA